MKDEIIIKRYADALVAYAGETCGVSKIIEDFRNLKNVILRDNPEFVEVLDNPGISYSEKSAFIEEVLGNFTKEETRQFLKLLIAKERINKLKDIIDFFLLNYEHPETIPALLKTSFPLDLDLIKEIEEKLEKKFKRKFKFYIDLDGSLMGGIKVEIGHNCLDGSVNKRIQDLRKKLIGANI